MAGRRDHHAGHAGAAPGLTLTRRGAMGAGLALLPLAARGATAPVAVPIRVSFNTPWTAVWLNKQGPFRFVIMSGTNVFQIAESLARRTELAGGEYLQGQTRFDTVTAKVFRADEMIIGGQVPLSRVRLIAAPGSDGAEPLFPGAIPVPSDRVTAFAWAAQTMSYSADLPDVGAYGKVQLRHYEGDLGWSPIVEGRLGGKPVRLTISTNSPNAVTLFPDAVKRLRLWTAPGASYQRSSRRDGREIELRMVRGGDLELGGLRFERPIIDLCDPAKALIDRNEGNDGQIGMEVLRRVDVIFDPRKDMSWMRPLPALAEPWSHDRAGFQIGYQDGARQVNRVDPGSPAERAGLKVGDRLSLGSAEAYARLEAAKTMAAGTKIDIPIVRDGAKMRIAVVTEERL